MDKVDIKSLDVVKDYKAKLKQLFPEVFKEILDEHSRLVEGINFDKLKAVIGELSSVYEGHRERYGMDWPGKKDCMKTVQQPSLGTLKPSRDESVNFGETENLFIEGDNLEVLKLLQKSYYNKVKMIYIDPPYNTGKEFIYPDNFTESLETYLDYAGLLDDEGRRFSTNTPNEGRFHTKWLNMMYPRLYLARNLLRDDGVIFISIDDNEIANLRKLCDEIYGEENYRNTFAVRRYDKNINRQFIENGLRTLNVGFEYVLAYSKTDKFMFQPVYREASEERQSSGYWKGFWNAANRPTMRYELLGVTPSAGQWKWKKETALQAVENYAQYQDKYQDKISLEEYWLKTDKSLLFIRRNTNGRGKNMGVEHWIPPSEGILRNTNLLDILASKSSVEIKGIFDFPKSVELLKVLCNLSCSQNDYVLDFFAGSCTTAHAVFELNKLDKGNRRFIMVQLPEPCDPNSEAFKADFNTIAEIGKERIRRVIENIEKEQKEATATKKDNSKSDENVLAGLDLGFKVFKLGRSNFKIWDGSKPDLDPDRLEEQLTMHVNHIDDKAEPEAILYELLLKAGYLPTERVEKIELAGKTVYSVAGGSLLICLEDEITRDLVNAVADKEPQQFISLDHGFKGNDQLKANAVQTFNARNQGKEKDKQIIFRTV